MKKWFLLLLFVSTVNAADYYYKGKKVGSSQVRGHKEYFYDGKGRYKGSVDTKGYHRRITGSKGQSGYIRGKGSVWFK